MRITSGINAAALIALTLGGVCSPAQEPVAPATAAPVADTEAPVSTHSKIRIVRLSEVKGEVQIDHETGKGLELAMANLPVVEGEKLQTRGGVAEIEFEDNSTVRVGENSMVEFSRLELLPTGAKASTLTILQGTVYVSLINTKGNEFMVDAGEQTIHLPPDSHVRLELTADQANLAVMHGEALVEQGSATTTVDKNKTMTFNLVGQGDPVIAKNVAEGSLDAWDKGATQYHKNFANASSYGNSPYAYGLSDLNYYGSFSSAGGCGSMWRPYFAGASWDPYGSGAFAYYPSAGYSWVSPYPWGWTPYHYGSWAFCQGTGWGWQPGGAWEGLNNYAYSASPNSTKWGAFHHPLPPSHPPVTSQSTLTPVNLKAIPTSTLKNDTFVFRQDSAGFGVPRGTLGKLNSFSTATAQHGAATTNVSFGSGEERGSSSGAARSSYSGSPSASSSSASSHSYSSGMQSSASSSGGSHASSGGSGSGGGGGGGRH